MKSKGTFIFKNPPAVVGHFSFGGPDEHKGPLGKYFDGGPEKKSNKKDKKRHLSYECQECEMFVEILDGALKSCDLKETDLDALLAGDLLNQIVSSSFAARTFDVPYFGLYNACATSAESLILGASLLDGAHAKRVACLTGSSFAAAERQYRGPLELGAQKPPYAQHTVTGGGCCILTSEKAAASHCAVITQATVGRVIDFGTLDQANMSASMAPAAADTLKRHFEGTGTKPEDYDAIVTGDLGKLGEDILRVLMAQEKMPLGKNYIDCGHMMYFDNQKFLQGGSGAGCGISVLCAYFLKRLEQGLLRKLLYVATGALLSTTMSQQGESIPAIAHAVVLETN